MGVRESLIVASPVTVICQKCDHERKAYPIDAVHISTVAGDQHWKCLWEKDLEICVNCGTDAVAFKVGAQNG